MTETAPKAAAVVAPTPSPDSAVQGGRSFAANVASLATSQVITWALALLWTMVVPRLIGPEQMGLLTIASAVTAVVSVVLGITTKDFLVREFVRDPAGAPRLLTLALVLRLATLPLVVLAGVAYGAIAGLDGRAMTVLLIVCAGTVCIMLAEPVLATFQARERMQYLAYTDVTNKALQTAGGILVAVAGFGVVAIAGVGLAVAILVLVLSLWWARRMVVLRARPAQPAPVIRRALPYWSVSVFFIAYLWADGLMLGLLAPPEVVGWYGAATRLFTTMMFVAVIIATSTLPRLVAAHARNPDDLYAVARKPFEWVVILGLPMGFGLACVADSVVPLLYGPEFAGASPALAVLAVGLPLMYVNIVMGQVFVASGRPMMMGRILALAASVNIVFNLLLIPYADRTWGNAAIGAALALLLTELVQVTVSMLVVGRLIVDRGVMVRVVKSVAAALVMTAVLLLLHGAPLAAQLGVGVVVFGSLLVLLRVPDEQEWAAARSGLAATRTRLGRGGRRDE
jgi:O-antigen/teichoic acid export membrane protein